MWSKIHALRRYSEIWIGYLALLLVLVTPMPLRADPTNRRQIREWTRLLRSEDPQKRSSAATSLLSATDPSALRVLQETLQPNEPEAVRVSVITAFGVKGDDRAVVEFINALGDPSESVRTAATSALQSINTTAAINHLMKAAVDPKRPSQLRRQVIGILSDLRALESIPTLIDLLTVEDEGVRNTAQDALRRITLRQFSTAAEWSAWWNHSASLSRDQMLEELVTLQDERMRAMNQKLERVYLVLLAERKDRNDPAPLIAALTESESARVKLYAIRELKDIAGARGAAVAEAMVRAIKDSTPAVRTAAAEALALYGDAGAPALVAALADPILDVRVAAARSLGIIKCQDAVDPLCDLLADPASEAATAAAVALGELAAPKAIDGLIRVVTASGSPTPLYEAAAHALAKIRDPRAAPTLVRLLESPRESVRWAAVDALPGVAGKEAIAPLSVVALKDANTQVREAALAAIGKIGDPAGMETLVEGLSDDQRRAAEQALRSLLKLAENNPALYGAALDRLIALKRYAQAEAVLAGALDQLSRGGNRVRETNALRHKVASGYMAAAEWTKARAHIEVLLAKTPENAAFIESMAACLAGQADADALLGLMAQARKNAPAQAKVWWQQSVKGVELLSGADATAKVIAAVDALEKENAEMGGPETAARLSELRSQARQKTGGATAETNDAELAPAVVQ